MGNLIPGLAVMGSMFLLMAGILMIHLARNW